MRLSTAHLRSVFTRYTFSLTFLLIFSFATPSEAGCPPASQTTLGWGRGSVVYYNVSSLPANLQTQAIAALNAWTSANTQNGSGVSFQASSSSHPATLTFQTGQTGSGAPSNMVPQNVDPNTVSTTASATITI